MSDCNACVSRRSFLGTGALGAVAVFLAACSDDGSATEPTTGTTPLPTPSTNSIRLTDYPALNAVGGMVRISGAVPIAVVRTATETYRAFSLVCPHAGSTVAIQGSGFRCPNHGATFSATGVWTGGQKTSNLREYTVTLNAAAGTLSIGS